MLNLGVIGFAQPWLLLALASLPVIWLLLRVTPPSPRTLSFPAIRLLHELAAPEETPAHTPPWLLILRLLIVALVIFALAQPLLNPSQQLYGSGPVVVVVDDAWPAARDWSKRQAAIEQLLAQAERENRPVRLLLTAPPANGEAVALSPLLPAGEARSRVKELRPKPWPADRAAALAAVEAASWQGTAAVTWFSDGLRHGEDDEMIDRFAGSLQRLGRLDVVEAQAGQRALLLLPPKVEPLGLTLRLQRAEAGPPQERAVLGSGPDGGILARTLVRFGDGEIEGTGQVELPVELRNRITQLQIENETSAGAVLLLDERWRRRPVGLVTLATSDISQPLLRENYYLERALEPFTELRRGEIDELLRREIAVLVMPDGAGALEESAIPLVEDWMKRGGILLRFAGPRIAENENTLLPVRLRGGDRVLGGALTWETPAGLAPFPAQSPFRGLTVQPDVLVTRQVLAEPTLDLPLKTWARLADGTPLVTAEERGDGWLVLVHTTANTDWSNLALSGLFVQMLKRLLDLSQGLSAAQEEEPLPPLALLDGFGVLGAPTPGATSLAYGPDGPAAAPDAAHPPGFYGKDSLRRAHNLGGALAPLAPLGALPGGVVKHEIEERRDDELKPWLLFAAAVLFLADLMISIILRGLLQATPGRSGLGRGALPLMLVASLLVGSLAAGLPGTAQAQTAQAQTNRDDQRALLATLSTRLAYVTTDIPEIDATSKAGLAGLSRVLRLRTSVEALAPMAVNIESDELAFYPLLYWPVTRNPDRISENAKRKVEDFMRNGGTILFDTRDPSAGAQVLGQSSRAAEALQTLLEGIDVPPLGPVPPDHVLTKAFYLMQDFPGRYLGGALWIEVEQDAANDGVTSILIGSNDWAGAWAVDNLGQPLHALVPGGVRQRELAYRFGVNLVMYALTGNYKADQVHVPFILERLGQ